MHVAVPRSEFDAGLRTYDLQPYRLSEKYVICKIDTRESRGEVIRQFAEKGMHPIVYKTGKPLTKLDNKGSWLQLMKCKLKALVKRISVRVATWWYL